MVFLIFPAFSLVLVVEEYGMDSLEIQGLVVMVQELYTSERTV